MPEVEIQDNQAELKPDTGEGQLSDIAKLIGAETPPEPKPEKDAPAEPEAAEAPVEIPDAPPVEPEKPAIDYKAEVPMPDGYESMTVGKLKDFYQGNHEWQSERDNWEVTRIEQENEQLVARQYLSELAQAIGGIDPEIVSRVTQQQAGGRETERQLLLQARPEWKDQTVMKAAGEKHLAHFARYGIPEQVYLGLADHRLIKMIDDAVRLSEQAERGRAKLKEAPAPAKAQKPRSADPKANQKAQSKARASRGDKAIELEAITALISGE